MRVNKFIRLWIHGGRGGIDDASAPVKGTGVINAAPTTTVSLLLTFIIASHRHQPKRKGEGEGKNGGGLASWPLWLYLSPRQV